MKTTPRISSLLNTHALDTSVTGLASFCLSALHLPAKLKVELPSNLRLGHLAEKAVSELLKASSNYRVLYENLQVIQEKDTIGELDFIIQDVESEQVIHLELAYKFYLYDPQPRAKHEDPRAGAGLSPKQEAGLLPPVGANHLTCWIGPNRNDSLVEKLDKLKRKQFPLLHHQVTKSILGDLDTATISQELCLLASLFVPYDQEIGFSESYQKGITGYYLNRATFERLDTSTKQYYIPEKKEWGIDPSAHTTWFDFADISDQLYGSLDEQRAVLCWEKEGEEYRSTFVVWWED